jgi:hypothetical protein
MGLHDPFGFLKHKLCPKERSGVKLAVWLLTIKVKNRLDFLACRWRDTYHWKDLHEKYNFVSYFISIGGPKNKLWAFKVVGVPISGISKLQLGSPKTKWHLGASPMANIESTIRGKVMASLKFGLWWILWICVCPWFVRAPKVLQPCIDQLV